MHQGVVLLMLAAYQPAQIQLSQGSDAAPRHCLLSASSEWLKIFALLLSLPITADLNFLGNLKTMLDIVFPELVQNWLSEFGLALLYV